jgi:hypothetical protein
VYASDGVAGCQAVVYVSQYQLLCQAPAKHIENATVVIKVGGQSSVASANSSLKYFDVPSIFDCWPGDELCMDCCEHHCTVEKIRARTATGRTAFECKKMCYQHCGTFVRKPSTPRNARILRDKVTGSAVTVAWDRPLDDGGRCVMMAFARQCCADCDLLCKCAVPFAAWLTWVYPRQAVQSIITSFRSKSRTAFQTPCAPITTPLWPPFPGSWPKPRSTPLSFSQ